MCTFIKQPYEKTELPFNEFIEIYSKAYFYSNPKIPGITYVQSNQSREEKVLKADVLDREGLGLILAWKSGKIKLDGDFYAGWNNCQSEDPSMGRYCMDISKLCTEMNNKKKDLDKYIYQEEPLSFIASILDINAKGIGPVYAIAILYFYSKGKYPIYDRFARVAINAINADPQRFPVKGESRQMTDYEIEYPKYIQEIEVLQREYQELFQLPSQINYLEYRNLDRALWIYGHGFNP
ncbi:hypothetical protein SAMN02910456_02222 [Ruminococcaceae bacterium YRB3002]|nr:hypothetical protein SAMN02910456_02222 [Ruminococcaceae bacterium YRB3002]